MHWHLYIDKRWWNKHESASIWGWAKPSPAAVWQVSLLMLQNIPSYSQVMSRVHQVCRKVYNSNGWIRHHCKIYWMKSMNNVFFNLWRLITIGVSDEGNVTALPTSGSATALELVAASNVYSFKVTWTNLLATFRTGVVPIICDECPRLRTYS